MLSKRRCPHTRILNFFTDIDPFMSVGSIIATGRARYVWRCHLVDHRCGTTTDAMSAETHLRRALEVSGGRSNRRYGRLNAKLSGTRHYGVTSASRAAAVNPRRA
jgi:hypothetical protein